MEDELWMVAAKQILSSSERPLHYTEIKRLILEEGLVNPGLKTTLEEALFKEIQKPCGRFRSLPNQPGVFELVKQEEEVPVAKSLIRKSLLKSESSLVPTKSKVSSLPYAVAVQERHRLKYKRLKQQIKDIVFINAAVCDDVVRVEEKVQKAKDERRYLLARLLQHQAKDESLQQRRAVSPSHTNGGIKHVTQSIAQILGEVEKRKKKTTPGVLLGGKKKSGRETFDEGPKPRGKKKVVAARRVVHQIPLDSLGRPIFPIELNHLTIYCLGEICPERSCFHSTEHIYPIGFCSTRVYASIHKPEEHSLYTCKIIDTNIGIKFDISPEDAPECVFTSSNINECHLKLLRAINSVSGMDLIPLLPRGADFFGLSHPTIQNLVQSCPGAKKCANYKWQRFEVSRMPPPEVNIHEVDEPTVSIDALYASPDFIVKVKATKQPQANLRHLLTNAPGTS